jgi:hypothetical protein
VKAPYDGIVHGSTSCPATWPCPSAPADRCSAVLLRVAVAVLNPAPPNCAIASPRR